MTFLADIDNNLIYLIAAAAYGVFAWWNDRRQKKAMAEEEKRRAADPTLQQSPKPADQAKNAEEERLRRFMEALGLPQNEQKKPESLRPTSMAPPAPAPAPKQPPKPASPTMAPRPIAIPLPRTMMRPEPRQPVPVPRPVVLPQRPRPVYVEEPEPVARRLVQGDEAGDALQQIGTDFAQFGNMAPDHVTMIPLAATGAAPVTGVEPAFVSPQGAAVRALLRTPETLRAAFIIREVIGPPRGL